METRSPVKPLPPGQLIRADFPRFGISPSTQFEIPPTAQASLRIKGDLETFTLCYADLAALERVSLRTDFHCVATWCYPGVTWSGFRLRDVYERLLKPHLPAGMTPSILVFKGLDGYRSSLPLEDALADEVLIADQLDGVGLSMQHGAPLRLVAPAHYGYKNIKHLAGIELWRNVSSYRSFLPTMFEHPRARVAYEERGRYLPGWVYRYLYRPLTETIVRRMNR